PQLLSRACALAIQLHSPREGADAVTPDHDTFLSEVQAGLAARPKTLPCKYLYDEVGSSLFERICELPEYYPTRADLDATRRHLDDIARMVGPRARLVELGSGSSTKTRLLLDRLEDLV